MQLARKSVSVLAVKCDVTTALVRYYSSSLF